MTVLKILKPVFTEIIEKETTENAVNKIMYLLLTDKETMLEVMVNSYNKESFGINLASLILEVKKDIANIKL